MDKPAFGPLALSLACAVRRRALGNTVEYTVTDLGTLGGDRSSATGINDAGQVVGFSNVTPGAIPSEAFLYSNGAMQGLGYLPGPGYPPASAAYGVNSSGPGGGLGPPRPTGAETPRFFTPTGP